MIAPSKETSCKAHLPVAPSTLVWAIAKMLHKLVISTVQEVQEEGSDDDNGMEDDGGVQGKKESDESDTENGSKKGQKRKRP